MLKDDAQSTKKLTKFRPQPKGGRQIRAKTSSKALNTTNDRSNKDAPSKRRIVFAKHAETQSLEFESTQNLANERTLSDETSLLIDDLAETKDKISILTPIKNHHNLQRDQKVSFTSQKSLSFKD